MPRAEQPDAAESTPLLAGPATAASHYGASGNANAASFTSNVSMEAAIEQPSAMSDCVETRGAAEKKSVGLGEVFSSQQVVGFLKVHRKFLCVLASVELVIILWAVLKPETRCHGQVRYPTN